jgi:hypothetical protein
MLRSFIARLEKVRRLADETIREPVTPLHFSKSTACAAAILKAWRDNDLEQLSQKLIKATILDTDLPEPSAAGECERRELLGGIAGEIRGIVATGRIEEAAVYLPLLRHLANPLISDPRGAYLC